MKVLKPRSALLSNREVLTHFTTYQAENGTITSALAAERQRRDRQKKAFDTYGFDAHGRLDIKGKKKLEASGHSGDHDTTAYSNGGMDVDRVGVGDVELKTDQEVAREKQLAIRGVEEDLVFVTDNVVKYLSHTAIVPTTRQTSSSIANLIRQLTAPERNYGLTKAEVFGCVNLAPTKLVELFMIVEECEDRLSLEKMEEIVALVAESLTSGENGDYEDEAGEDHDYGASGEGYYEEDALVDEEEEYALHWGQGGGQEEFYAESKWGGEAGIEDEGDGAIDE